MINIPKSHPRYNSLKQREMISTAMSAGIVHETGLIAHGRGEAFDYLIGEKTPIISNDAEKVSAAKLILSKKPVISINGNVAALVPKQCIKLAESINGQLEINLFHRTLNRIQKIEKLLKKQGAKKVYGLTGDAQIPGLDHNRGICDKQGIFSAEVILVPLEDGDRCQALKNMGKTVIAIDLNPLSRTAKTADITIVDNVIRAIPNITQHILKLKKMDNIKLAAIINSWNNKEKLNEIYHFLSKRLNYMCR